MSNSSKTYSRLTIALHWIGAILFLLLLTGGTLMTDFIPKAEATTPYQGHVTFGLLTAVYLVVRIVARVMEKNRLSAPAGLAGWNLTLYNAIHVLLYVVPVVMILTGVGMLLLSGLGLSPANVTPDAIGDVAPRGGHDIFSKVMILLVLLHVGGVLRYQFTKGDILGRMGIPWFQK
jgi:cytochrome b561